MSLVRLIRAMRDSGFALEADELADIIWLANQLPATKKRKIKDTPKEDNGIQQTQQDTSRPDTSLSDYNPSKTYLASENNAQTSVTKREAPARAGVYIPFESGESTSGISFSARGVSALPNKLEFARALRPLLRQVSSRHHFELDEDATVHRIADTQIWLPVMRPTPTRWLDLDVIIDEWPSIVLWRESISELITLLSNLGAFRSVQIWSLWTSSDGSKVEFHAGWGAAAEKEPRRPLKELVSVRGNRLILVLSDTVSPAWYNGSIAQVLNHWIQSEIVALFHLLPYQFWNRTGLVNAIPTHFRATTPARPNSQLIAISSSEDNKKLAKSGFLPLPTLPFDPRLIASWAQAVAGRNNVWIPGVMLPLDDKREQLRRKRVQAEKELSRSEAIFDETSTALAAVKRYQKNATPEAWKIAGYLSAAWPLNLPLMRLVQQVMLPESNREHLAEFFLSGLIQGVVGSDFLSDKGARYEFIRGVRRILLSSISRLEAVDVIRRTSQFISRESGKLIDFDTLVANPELASQINPDATPFAELSQSVLRSLGGEYATLADALVGQTIIEDVMEKTSLADNNLPPEASPFTDPINVGGHNNIIHTEEISPSPVSTLPLQPLFVGREKELDIIKSALSPDSRTWGALIDGPGGIGKTALAIKAAHDAPTELFERKIFITAKVRELTAEGEIKLTDFTRPTYLAMLDELGWELGVDGLEKLAPDERPNELRLALAGKKALIIFDNLETLPEKERTRLFQFLSRLPEGNKAIVTSRRLTDVDARIVRLDRLARDEALQLIAELAAKHPRLVRTTQKEREDLYEITQGNPLFIRWIAGQLGREGSHARTIAEAAAFIDSAPKGNDPLEYIFGDLLETFTADETKVLAALTYFSLAAKLKWIADMTDLPERRAETALEDLTDRSILISNLESRAYFLPPLTANFIRTRRPEAVTQTGNALTDRAYALAMQYGGGGKDYEKFPMLDAEWSFVSAALPHLLTGDNDRLQTVCAQLETFLNYTGRWDDLLWLSEQAEARALAADDKENAGWRAYIAGYTYSLRNQPAEVLACAARATEHWQDSTPQKKATTIRLSGIGHRLNKDYLAAIAAYQKSLEIYRTFAPESNDVAISLSNLAEVERLNKDYPAAERDYREALHIDRKNHQQEGIAIDLGNLAELALDREQWAEAESLAREALALAEKIGRQELIAGDCHRLAKALIKQKGKSDWQSDLQEALSMSRRAVEIYARLKSPDVEWAQETLAEIERAMQKSE